MIINKNKTKIIPILNKSLKEIYFNKDYDVIALFSLLKENEQSIEIKKFIVKSDIDGLVDVYSGTFNNKQITDAKFLYTFDNSLDKTLDTLTKEIFNYQGTIVNKKNTQEVFIKNLNQIVLVFIDECIKNGMFKNMFTIRDLLEYIKNNKQLYLNNLYNIVVNIRKILRIKSGTFGKFQIVDEFNVNDKKNIKSVKTQIFPNKDFDISYIIKSENATEINTNLENLNNDDDDDEAESKKDKTIKITYYLKKEINNLFDYIIDYISSSEAILNKKIFNYDDDDEKYQKQIQIIAKEYTSNYDKLLVNILNKNINKEDIRKTPHDIEDVVKTLNDKNNSLHFTTDINQYIGTGKGNIGSTKGKGELAVHLMFQTTNVCTLNEPDAIIHTKSGELLKCSVKCMSYNLQASCGRKNDVEAFMQSLGQSGKELNEKNLNNALYDIIKQKFNEEIQEKICDIFKIDESELSKHKLNNEIKYDPVVISNKYREFKQKILKQGGADYVLIVDPNDDNNRFSLVYNNNIDQLCDLININYYHKQTNSFSIIRNITEKCVTKNYEDNIKKIVKNYYPNTGVEKIISYILYFLNKNEENYLNDISTPDAFTLIQEIRKFIPILTNLTEKNNNKNYNQVSSSANIKKSTNTALTFVNKFIQGNRNKDFRDNYINKGRYYNINTTDDIDILNQIKTNLETLVNYIQNDILVLSDDDDTKNRINSRMVESYCKEIVQKKDAIIGLLEKAETETETAAKAETKTENVGYKRKGMTLREVFKNLY